MSETLGTITAIEEVHDLALAPIAPLNGRGGARAGFSQMLGMLTGSSNMDGYKVVTDQHVLHVLIDNEQSCCEDWGYLSSDDRLDAFIGAELVRIELTDTALNKQKVDEVAEYGFDAGGIQFVDLVTDRGPFQLAVYNGHNGYYGHGILVAKDNDVLLSDTL